MLQNKALWTTVGFLLIIIGFLALAMSMVGLKFAFLQWMDLLGGLGSFITKLVMVLGGFVLVYMAQTDLSQAEDEEEIR
jgi:uncharacterized membrane protein